MDGGSSPSPQYDREKMYSGAGFVLGSDYLALKTKNQRVPIVWDPSNLANHHVAVLGTSGSGKTTWIRRFVSQVPSDVEVDVLDYHGDINVDHPECREALYSEQTRHGYNPLRVNPDPHYGGVRRAIKEVLDAFDQTANSRLGIRQAELLRSLLIDVYSARGIHEDTPSTWRRQVGNTREIQALKEAGDLEALNTYFPTLTDVYDLARRRSFALLSNIDDTGEGRSAIDAFEEFRRNTAAFHRIAKRVRTADFPNEETAEKAQTSLANQRRAAVAAFDVFLGTVESGREVEEISVYGNKETFMAVMSRLRGLVATGLFEPNPPAFGSARIRRHNLRPLAQSQDDLNMFIRLRLQSIVKEMMQAGYVDGRLRRLLVLDESKPFNSEDADNPINVIATQMRKFGLGLMLASQSIHHLSGDFVKNAATLLILDADTQEWDAVSRSLRISKNVLGSLKHHTIAAIRMRTKDGQTHFRGLYLR